MSTSTTTKRVLEDVAFPDIQAKKQKLGQRKSVDKSEGYLVPLRLTVRSGYLSTEEVGRLLFFTGKSFMGDIFEDTVDFGRRGGVQEPVTHPSQITEDSGPFRYINNIQLTRNQFTKQFGFYIINRCVSDDAYVVVNRLRGDLLAPQGTIQVGDCIISVNGEDAKGWNDEKFKGKIHGHGDKVMLSLRRMQPDLKEQIWKCICQHKWKDAKTLSHLIAFVGCVSGGNVHWEGLFRKFLEGPTVEPRPPPDDIYFLLSLHHYEDHNTHIACQFVEGENARMLLEEGRTQEIEFNTPIFIGTSNAHCDKGEDTSTTFRMSLHALRKSDQKSCLLGAQYVHYVPSAISPTIVLSNLFERGVVDTCEVPPSNDLVHNFEGNEVLESIDLEIRQKLHGKITVAGPDCQADLLVYATGVSVDWVDVIIQTDDSIISVKFPSTGPYSCLRPNVSLKDFLEKMNCWK